MPEIEALSVRDVAERLAVSTRHVHRLIARRELPSLRVGRRRLVRRETLRAWLAGREMPPNPSGNEG